MRQVGWARVRGAAAATPRTLVRRSVARVACGDRAFDVDVGVIGHIEDDLLDLATRVLASTLVCLRHPVAAVVADAEPLTAEREVARLRADRVGRDIVLVDVQGRWTVPFAVLTALRLLEGDAEDVLARAGQLSLQHLRVADPQEVVLIAQLAAGNVQCVTAEPRPLGEDDALRGIRRQTSASTLNETAWVFAAERSGTSLVFG